MRSIPPKALGGLSDSRLPRAGAVYPESGDAAAIHRHHFHFPPRYRDPITHVGEPSELRKGVPAERGPVSVGDLDAVVGTDIDE